jgi:predicted transcriptional regulator
MAVRKKDGAGGKLARSEVVTVRLDPRLRYGVELAAQKHRRTASSFIEWAVENALREVVVREDVQGQWSTTVDDVLNQVWDVDEADRFAKLAINFPELLKHDEQVLWKLIRECGLLWRGSYVPRGKIKEWTWRINAESLRFETLREYWDTFKGVAQGELPPDKLPNWLREQSLETDFDNEIPF